MNRISRQWLLVGLGALILAVTGCASGEKGDTGAAAINGTDGSNGGPGPQGPPGGVSEIQNTLTGKILSASVPANGQPVITFTLTDQNGQSYANLGGVAQAMEFTIAKLVPPAANSGDASYWENYIVTTSTGAAGTFIKGSREKNTTGNLTYANGIYTFTFATNIKSLTAPGGAKNSPLAVIVNTPGNMYKTVDLSYQPTYTTRVGFALRGNDPVTGAVIPFANATCDFVPGAAFTGCGQGLTTSRYIVKTDTCNQCHNRLELHGGTRIDTKYCVTCHNPGSVDAVSGNTVDFKQFIHRLHNGASLPSVFGGAPFGIGSTDFSTAVFPQMIPGKAQLTSKSVSYFPTCAKCHVEGVPDTQGNTVTDAASWKNVATIEACTSCHDNVTFVSPAGAGQILHKGWASTGNLTDNTSCANCHASTSGIAITVDKMHGYTTNLTTAGGSFKYNIGAVTLNTGTGVLTAVVSVTNPNVTGAFYDLQQDTVFCTATKWDNTNKTCFGTSGSLTLGIAIGAAEHTNGSNGSIITPSSVVSLSLLNPLNYSSGDVAQGSPTPPAVTGTVAATACGGGQTSSVGGAGGNCTFTASLTLPPNALAAVNAAGSFTAAVYGAPKLANIANNSLNVTGNACATAAIGTSSGSATNPCVTVSPPVAAVTTDFGVTAACGTTVCPTLSGSSARRVAVVTDNAANGNTGGSCNTCHGMVQAHGGSRAGNAQLCVMCHNPNNTDLDQRPNGKVSLAMAADGLREHSVDFKVMIHGIHAGATTNSITGLALAAAPAWPAAIPAPTLTNGAHVNGQKRETGLVVYGFGNGVFDFGGVKFPGHLDNCTNCHTSTGFTLPLSSAVLPTTMASVPAAANQWESLGHTMTLGSTTCSGTTEGVNTGTSVICMLGANYATTGATSGGIPLVVTAYASASQAVPTGLAVCTNATPCYVLNSVAAGSSTTVGTFQLAQPSGSVTPLTISTAGAGTFAIGPANMNVAAQGTVWSPAASVCTSCHDSATAAQHILETGNAVFSPWPGGVTPVDHVQPYGNFRDALTSLTKGTYATNAAAGYGDGIETCSVCHGPGTVADVSVVHRIGQ